DPRRALGHCTFRRRHPHPVSVPAPASASTLPPRPCQSPHGLPARPDRRSYDVNRPSIKTLTFWKRIRRSKHADPRSARCRFRPTLELLTDRVVPSTTGVISGHVYQDLSGNGLTADDAALGGVTVKLYKDSNHTGVKDSGDALVATKVSAA